MGPLFRKSLHAIFDAEVAAYAARNDATEHLVTERDLDAVPPAVRTYLSRAGVVGRPRTRDFEARFVGEMHIDPKNKSSKLTIVADQRSFFGRERARLFLIRGRRMGIPFEGLHMYRGASATMEIRLASLVRIADARGPKMDVSETVTMLNDMCILAPSTLLDADIEWTDLGPREAGARFTNAGHTVTATITFDERGDFASFRSEDRYQSADGKVYLRYPWSTPMREIREIDGRRIATVGDAVWEEPSGPFVYATFTLEHIRYDLTSASK